MMCLVFSSEQAERQKFQDKVVLIASSIPNMIFFCRQKYRITHSNVTGTLIQDMQVHRPRSEISIFLSPRNRKNEPFNK